jgi:DNA-binding IclR family transcriptional regulator
MFHSFCDHAPQSIRQVAQQTGLSKSSGHRLKQAMERRDTPPESWWWATDAGHGWFLRLVVATLSTFGLTRGVGAATIRECVGRLRLETRMGCSPSALRGMRQALEQAILETAQGWEHEGRAEGAGRPLMGAGDDPF